MKHIIILLMSIAVQPAAAATLVEINFDGLTPTQKLTDQLASPSGWYGAFFSISYGSGFGQAGPSSAPKPTTLVLLCIGLLGVMLTTARQPSHVIWVSLIALVGVVAVSPMI